MPMNMPSHELFLLCDRVPVTNSPHHPHQFHFLMSVMRVMRVHRHCSGWSARSLLVSGFLGFAGFKKERANLVAPAMGFNPHHPHQGQPAGPAPWQGKSLLCTTPNATNAQGICGMSQVRLVSTTLRGVPVGESSPNTRWPDTMVAQAKALRAEGMPIRKITANLNGPHHATVWRWVAGVTRKPAARVIARRVKPMKRLEKAGVHPPLAPENQHDSPGTPQMTPYVPKNEHVGPFDDLA